MANSNEYMREYMKRRYHQRRERAISELGGSCVKCRKTSDLEFDHKDRRTKNLDVARRLAGCSEAKFVEELPKLQLLCKDCHHDKSRASGDYEAWNKTSIVCCGRTFTRKVEYAGHKRWCGSVV